MVGNANVWSWQPGPFVGNVFLWDTIMKRKGVPPFFSDFVKSSDLRNALPSYAASLGSFHRTDSSPQSHKQQVLSEILLVMESFDRQQNAESAFQLDSLGNLLHVWLTAGSGY